MIDSVRMLTRARFAALALLVTAIPVGDLGAQEPATRAEVLARQKAEKSKVLTPAEPSRAEQLVNRAEDLLLGGSLNWRPFFESAYAGGGFTMGAGYRRFVSPYNTIDVRGSITFSGYKRIEAEFLAPRLFDRRGLFSVVGGWREATQVGFFGIGTPNTSSDDRANYSFSQPYLTGRLEFRPTRRYVVLDGGLEFSQWNQGSGSGSAPSVEEVYTPETLPGLGASPTYLHSHGGAAFDWRPAPGHARRGGAYGVVLHDFADRDGEFGFRRVDYDVVQHVPILRDAWVLSLRGRVETTYGKDDQEIPFFMLPALGGGSTLRGFSSWRFRDRHSLLLQAEWRVLVNRFLDVALFYDAGKVVDRRSDLDLDGLKKDFGLGFRFHGPTATPLRIELARSNEGLALVFSSKAPF